MSIFLLLSLTSLLANSAITVFYIATSLKFYFKHTPCPTIKSKPWQKGKPWRSRGHYTVFNELCLPATDQTTISHLTIPRWQCPVRRSGNTALQKIAIFFQSTSTNNVASADISILQRFSLEKLKQTHRIKHVQPDNVTLKLTRAKILVFKTVLEQFLQFSSFRGSLVQENRLLSKLRTMRSCLTPVYG